MCFVYFFFKNVTLTRFDRNVCAAGPDSMCTNRVWPAGIVLECDHDLLSHLCFDYWTYRGKETHVYFSLLLVRKKRERNGIKTN